MSEAWSGSDFSYAAQPVVLGDTANFQLNAEKDGVVWDLAGALVQLYFLDPSAVAYGPYTATVNGNILGQANYQVPTGLLNAVGDWRREWVVNQSGLVLKSKEIVFSVVKSLA